MKIACIFPGQGTQKVGMGLEIYRDFKVAKAIFDKADDVLGQKLSKIIFEGPIEKLTLTENTQVALMVCSIALLRVFEERAGKRLHSFCSYVAGHSVGEFTALIASGALPFCDGVKLLKLRGKAMQAAAPDKGAMFALLGANIKVATQIAKETGIYVANDNSPAQQVLSGENLAIQKAIQLSQAKGYKAIKLNVSGPFHSKLMEPAKKSLELALAETEFNTPRIPIVSNFTGEIMSSAEIKPNLLLQLTNTVKWCDSIRTLKKLGAETVLEIGPGAIYTNLTKRIDATLNAITLNDTASIDVFVEQSFAKVI